MRVTFRLAKPTPLLNVTYRQHWRVRRKHQVALAWECRAALAGQMPAAPFERAHIRIVRCSSGTPDDDNLVGGTKGLVDVLCSPTRHPLGIGLIFDDDPSRLTREVVAWRVPRADQCTIVTVTELAHV